MPPLRCVFNLDVLVVVVPNMFGEMNLLCFDELGVGQFGEIARIGPVDQSIESSATPPLLS